MKKYFLIFPFLIITICIIAQNTDTDKNFAHYKYRTEISEPNYNLKKIRELIIKNNKGYGNGNALSETMYRSFNLREKFTYNMIHAESYSQNCGELFLLR